MSNWDEKPLISLARYINGFAFKPHHWGEEGLPIVRIEQLNNPDGYYDFCMTPIPSDNIVDNGDLIFSWSATLKVALWQHGKAALNQHLFKVQPNPGVDKDYLYQLLDFHMEALAGGSHGSTMKHIKRSELYKYCVRVPDISVQKTISKILRAVDAQIDVTQKLIAKQERVRAGLMQDLFTRGVDKHGQLRPDREEAPHLYHETELGWLPNGWDAVRLSDLTSRIVDGVHHTPTYVPQGVPFITVKSLTAGRGIDTRQGNFISIEDHRIFQIRADPKAGDVLVSKDGTLGVARQVDESVEEFSIFVSVAMLRPIASLLCSAFLCEFFQTRYYENQLGYLSAGSGLKHIHLEHFRKFVVPLPELPEQKRIIQILSAADKYILGLERALEKLRLQKSGLMQDLLTGKISVAPLLQAAAE
ncbi:restriction endonuclease subunit S [Bradyrhizobium ontarionense]|uniref:Restriction endonuclease subunit S n=1 Tax=Bradyrhizobium ontarionense TaxID=2898149 RepID=A0ABY3R477_9BRAD|nr:restriction endonuclease subunit S [Bradyrhizobium sp. A19]UFZ02116.1 restriction endonuclease subunit S [Bradyrhizobium sp. A19]